MHKRARTTHIHNFGLSSKRIRIKKRPFRMITCRPCMAISGAPGCPTNTNEAEKISHLNGISFDRRLKSFGSVSLFFSVSFSCSSIVRRGAKKKIANINCTKQWRAAGVARRHGNNSLNTGQRQLVVRVARTAIPGNISVLFAFFLCVALFVGARIAYGSGLTDANGVHWLVDMQ